MSLSIPIHCFSRDNKQNSFVINWQDIVSNGYINAISYENNELGFYIKNQNGSLYWCRFSFDCVLDDEITITEQWFSSSDIDSPFVVIYKDID